MKNICTLIVFLLGFTVYAQQTTPLPEVERIPAGIPTPELRDLDRNESVLTDAAPLHGTLEIAHSCRMSSKPIQGPDPRLQLNELPGTGVNRNTPLPTNIAYTYIPNKQRAARLGFGLRP